MKRLSILGSTGSIGQSALAVVRAMKGRFKIVGLTANENIDLLENQAREFKPKAVALVNEVKANILRRRLASRGIRVWGGINGLLQVAQLPADMVISSMVGAAGLLPTLAALKSGKDIALANKEPLVMAGPLFMKEARRCKARILPVDSEHSAIFQCLQGQDARAVKRIILTASGGPFLNTSMKKLKKVTAQEALAHPTWRMGRKVTLDSATLMNKGLEVIEAHHLFGVSIPHIEVLVHPQSIIHSMVEFTDSSVLAQMSNPDMKLPLQYALTFPERKPGLLKSVDFIKLGKLEFKKPDMFRFPCLSLAFNAARRGGTAPAVLNAANEVTGAAFFNGQISFMDIPKFIGIVLSRHKGISNPELSDVLRADAWAREETNQLICDRIS